MKVFGKSPLFRRVLMKSVHPIVCNKDTSRFINLPRSAGTSRTGALRRWRFLEELVVRVEIVDREGSFTGMDGSRDWLVLWFKQLIKLSSQGLGKLG